MDVLVAIGIFLLGSAAGAFVTATLYVSRMREIRRLLEASPHYSWSEQSPKPEEAKRKSA